MNKQRLIRLENYKNIPMHNYDVLFATIDEMAKEIRRLKHKVERRSVKIVSHLVKHKPEDCPYLHVKKCKGCGRSCDCDKKQIRNGLTNKKSLI